MSSLEKVLFPIGSFEVQLWHILAVVALILVVVIIVVIAVVSRKKSRAKQETQAQTTTETNDQQETVVDTKTETDTAEEEEPSVVEETAATTEEPTEEEPAKEDEVVEQEKTAKPRPKNYHISLREDGKWQVKLAKGEKALKLFDTQEEAIAFAKEKAKNQDGSITIHKKDGKIRKQNY